jgi:hypothetical protein
VQVVVLYGHRYQNIFRIVLDLLVITGRDICTAITCSMLYFSSSSTSIGTFSSIENAVFILSLSSKALQQIIRCRPARWQACSLIMYSRLEIASSHWPILMKTSAILCMILILQPKKQVSCVLLFFITVPQVLLT